MMSFNRRRLTLRQAAKVPPRNGHEYHRVQPGLKPVPIVSHPDAGPTAAYATDIYTSSTRTATAAAFTTFTAALPTDIYTATCTGATAVPKHAVRAAHKTTAAATHTTTAAAHTTAATAAHTTRGECPLTGTVSAD